MTDVKSTSIQVASTIDDVIEQLDAIIARARDENSRLGYFPALYRRVTVKVKEKIQENGFEDNERMEQLDVIFANRYLKAYQEFQNGLQPTRSWQVAFDATRSWRLLILQHLLLGINAHINLDLGIAAAVKCPGPLLPDLKQDFFDINKILGSCVDLVQDQIGSLSPWFALLDWLGGRDDEAIVNFSMQRARDAAWDVAQKFAYLDPAEMETEIDKLDQKIERLAKRVRNPGWLLRTGLFIIRIVESNNVRQIIDILNSETE